MTRRWSPLIALLVLGVASPAQAWDAFFRVSSETTVRVTSETTSEASSASTRAGNRERRAQASNRGAGMQCTADDECAGWCRDGLCADPAPPAAFYCVDDSSCAPGFACRDRQCVEAVPQPVPVPACSTDAHCYQGQSCINGQCINPPPPPPPGASLWRRGSEFFLRDRTVQLRQDLALGEGPVIATLAELHGVSARLLGRAMRAHRAELVALMGDGKDVTWTRRFLLEVEALCEQQARVSVR
jgi:Cys-rich repeat protein